MEPCVNNEVKESKGTVSLEDKINNATLETYQELMPEIAALGSDVLTEGYIGKLADKIKVKPKTLMKEIGVTENAEDMQLCAVFPELVDLVEDNAGKVGYLVKQDDGIGYADSWTKDDGTTCYPPGKEHLQYKLGNSKRIQDHYARNEDAGELFDDLIFYCKRFSYLPNDTWPLIVFSVFLSYLQDHKDVRYIPMIYFYAVAERGKSRTAKSMLSVSYRGVHCGDMSTAAIFRYSQDQKATLFLDCTDLWKTALKAGGQDILLNRFEKGATVPRVLHPDRGAFLDIVHYEIYGSTIVATNEPADPTFESRCISITMPNKPGEYEDIRPEMGVPLKERLTAWRARMMDQHLPDIRPIDGLSGRLWDITKPLFQLCELIKPDVKEDMRNVLLGVVEKKAEDMKESIEGQVVAALDELADFDGEHEVVISNDDLLEELNRFKDTRYKMSSGKLGFRTRSLGLRKKTVNGCRQIVTTRAELDLLKQQYGLLKPVACDEGELLVDKEGNQVEGCRESRELLEALPEKTHSSIA